MEPHCYQHQNWIPSRKENWKKDYHKTTEKSPKQQIIKAQKMLLRFSWHPKMLVSETKRGTPQTKHNSKYNQGLFYYIKDGKLQGLMLCFLDNMLRYIACCLGNTTSIWGGTDEFKVDVIDLLGQIFTICFKFSQAFSFFGIEIHQNDKFKQLIRITILKLSNQSCLP